MTNSNGESAMSMKTMTAQAIETDDDYAAFEQLIRQRVSEVTGPVFDTDVSPDDLWRTWLEAIPADKRQHYNCHSCRHFIQKYGRLVTIDDDGFTNTAIWYPVSEVPAFFREGCDNLGRLVESAKVTGVFLWGEKDRVWGTPSTGGWTHLCGTPTAKFYANPLKTPQQESAVKKEDYGILCRSLADYGPDVIAQAVRVLESDTLCRSEKALGVAKWAADLYQRLEGKKGTRRSNLIWSAVATAPVGFCHLRSTVISTLLDDIAAGLPFATISRKWSEKLHPLQYQRPTATPTAGAIAEAERVFEKMGAGRALERRYAKLADVLSKLWVPRRDCVPVDLARQGGLFAHLKQDKQTVREVELPAQAITFEKFRRDVLPSTSGMEVLVPSTGPFYGLVTAVHPDAPALLQWDGLPDRERNPVSWYFWHGGSSASRWGLRANEWTEVTALFLSPHQWQCPDLFQHQGLNAFFALKGCREDRTNSPGLALFPETLRSEYHAVRSVIEAHSRKSSLVGHEDGDANGIAFQKGSSSTLTVRVRTAGGLASYRIDRWD